MENLQAQPTIKELVLQQIDEGAVLVTPKWRFTAVTVLSGIGLLASFLIVLFVITLIHFSLRESGVLALPEFGGEGLREFLLSLPWVPIALLLVAAFALEFWLLRYAFAYRQPLLYSVFGIAACLTLGTVLVATAKVHEGVYEVAESANVPIMRPLYHSVVQPDLPKLHRGMVAEVEEHGFLLRGRGGQIVDVQVTRQTRLAPPVAVRVGEMVIVFGQAADGSIHAIGVKHMPAIGRASAPGMRP
ncbi:MAG: hypothetical protein WC813_03900 [Patescibacteria group bacterium]|jgi:hypothetical protein